MPTIGRHVAKLSGYAPALRTPFDDNGEVDGEAFERHCDLQITCGAAALVVGGTTGEASTLTSEEQGELIRIAVAVSRGRRVTRSRAGHCRSGLERDRSRDCLG
jgi:4-hydroxy-tetrahydrodipicolinate synthase